ncbi:hypothetical protein PybrP1_010580, partial [[Pythium] brassicae (nom. inval.)]
GAKSLAHVSTDLRTRSYAKDALSLRVKDGKFVEVSSGAESVALRVDHVFQQGSSEDDVMERSLLPLVKACVEGVNVGVLALGSVASRKSALLFEPLRAQSIAQLVVHVLLASLDAKAAALRDASDNSDAKRMPGFSSELSVSFVEFFEETMMDLLLPHDSGAKRSARTALAIESCCCGAGGKRVAHLSNHGPIPSSDAFQRLLEAANRARRREVGLYGSAGDFSSAILEISLKQSFRLPGASTQELHSRVAVVELPATDRLSRVRPGAAVRLSEGPLLNKALFTLADVVDACAGSPPSSTNPTGGGASGSDVPTDSYPAFDDSHLTALLHDVLGGNCLTLALLCVAPNDFMSSKASLQLGRALLRVVNFPVVNNDMVQGLLRRHFRRVARLETAVSAALTSCERGPNTSSSGSAPPSERLSAYERKLHELEGRLAQEALEKRVVRDDKERLVALLGELKRKYAELFDSELEMRKELLACEQEKLALSKAFMQFELESNGRAKALESDKFEAETKLLQAEQMVLEIQQDDSEKATQVQDLVAKMNELIREKQVLSEELALLQSHSKQLDEALQREAKKNQQLSLELLVVVNQKQKAQRDAESAEARTRQLAAQLDDLSAKSEQPRAENTELKDRLASLNTQLESLRRELVVKALEAEKLSLHARTTQLEQESGAERLSRECESKLAALAGQLEAAHAQSASERTSLALQLERAALDLAACSKEKEELAHAWTAKSQETEELLVANERLVHERDAQVEAFRLKIAFLASSADSAGAPTGEAVGSGLAALRELVESYQSHEKQLRSQLAQQRSVTFRLEKRLRASAAAPSSFGVRADERPLDTLDERTLLLQEVRDAQSQVALEREKLAAAVLARVDLERVNQTLTQECATLARAAQQSCDDDKQHVDAIRGLHEALLRQLEEVRVQVTQQQPAAVGSASAAKRFASAAATAYQHQLGSRVREAANDSSSSSGTCHAEQLLWTQEKQHLEAKLAASTRQWTALVEQVERRCAALLTNNVMLVQENSDLREHLMTKRTREVGLRAPMGGRRSFSAKE